MSKFHLSRAIQLKFVRTEEQVAHIFDGEEYCRAVRYFTGGYDIYSPSRCYVVHNSSFLIL